MTNITVETPIFLKTTHFKNAQELMEALLQTEFENHLDQQYKKAKWAPKEDFVSL